MMIEDPRGALPAAGDEPEGADEERTEAAEPTAEQKELFDLVVGRTLDALSQDADGLDSALKADPVQGTVGYGTKALRAIAQSAKDAGKPIPFDVLIGAGMQVIKEIGAIAQEKGYLPDEAVAPFLKESFQQSLVAYAKMDMADGSITPDMLKQVQGAVGGAAEAEPRGALPQGGM